VFSCALLHENWFNSSMLKSEMSEFAVTGALSLLESPQDVKRIVAQAIESLIIFFMRISICLRG